MEQSQSSNAIIFDQEIPTDFQRDAVRLIRNRHQLSHNRCFQSRHYAEAHYLYPHQRRADIEGSIRDLAISYGLSARPEPFPNNGDFFSLIETEHVICTISHVDDQHKLPRGAKSRETIANEAQWNLFSEEPPPPGTKLYAIIVYGGSTEASVLPSFINVIFPSRNYSRIADSFSLLSKFMDDLGDGTAGTNDIPDSGGPTIRTQPQTDA